MENKRILVVDDEVDFATLTADLLESHQFHVNVVYTGIDALEQSKNNPDLILLDRRLPDIDGLEICARIKKDEHLKSIPIIMVSAFSEPKGQRETFYDDYVMKPYNTEEFIAKIESFLRNK